MSETIVELFLIDEVVLEDRHLELERAIIVLVVDEEHTDEFLADIDLGGIILLRPRYDADLGIAEYALQIRVELPNFLDVHGKSPIEIWVGGVLGRDATNRQHELPKNLGTKRAGESALSDRLKTPSQSPMALII
jgi:hypothetical protein